MKKVIIGFILGGIVFGSIGIMAAMSAKEIPYKINDKVINVEDALNELYDHTNNSSLIIPYYGVTGATKNSTLRIDLSGKTSITFDYETRYNTSTNENYPALDYILLKSESGETLEKITGTGSYDASSLISSAGSYIDIYCYVSAAGNSKAYVTNLIIN